MIRYLLLAFCFLVPFSIYSQQPAQASIYILGITQDGGYPHMGCKKACCSKAWKNPSLKKLVVSFALIDPLNKKWYLFEATPDIKEQLQLFSKLSDGEYNYLPDAIFITHAHIGHYTGLMQLGREVMNTNNVPVYVLERMKQFIELNGPWSQLVKLQNIQLHQLQADTAVQLSNNISVTAFTVPHRDEYSETAGFRINTGSKKYLFIPDINKWDKWNRNIVSEIQSVDIALIDATFYDGSELPGARLSEVPHPFIIETMELFQNADKLTRSKIYFIHLNHTNPLLLDAQKQSALKAKGFHIAEQGQKL